MKKMAGKRRYNRKKNEWTLGDTGKGEDRQMMEESNEEERSGS